MSKDTKELERLLKIFDDSVEALEQAAIEIELVKHVGHNDFEAKKIRKIKDKIDGATEDLNKYIVTIGGGGTGDS